MKTQSTQPIRILFVCLGNICRSPAAEAIFADYVKRTETQHSFEVSSAGISAHHAGEMADSRMRRHASSRGYSITSLSQPVSYEDFYHYDYIIAMDLSNKEALMDRCPEVDLLKKISMLTEWHPQPSLDHVPDPYYGGAQGFEEVLDFIESCVPYLVQKIDQ